MGGPEKRENIRAIYRCPGGANHYKPGPTEPPHDLIEEYIPGTTPPQSSHCVTHGRSTTLISVNDQNLTL